MLRFARQAALLARAVRTIDDLRPLQAANFPLPVVDKQAAAETNRHSHSSCRTHWQALPLETARGPRRMSTATAGGNAHGESCSDPHLPRRNCSLSLLEQTDLRYFQEALGTKAVLTSEEELVSYNTDWYKKSANQLSIWFL